MTWHRPRKLGLNHFSVIAQKSHTNWSYYILYSLLPRSSTKKIPLAIARKKNQIDLILRATFNFGSFLFFSHFFFFHVHNTQIAFSVIKLGVSATYSHECYDSVTAVVYNKVGALNQNGKAS